MTLVRVDGSLDNDGIRELQEAVNALDGRVDVVEGGDLTGLDGDPLYPRWDDLRVSLTRAQAAAGSPSFKAFGVGQSAGWAFRTGDALWFDAQLPHSALLGVEGAEVRPHVHWSPGASTGTGIVQWTLDVSWANPVNEPDNEFTVLSGSPLAGPQAGAGVAYRHQIATFGSVDASDFRASTVLLCRLSRVVTDDTFGAVDAFALSVDFHYRVADPGSVDEYPTG